MPCSNNKVSCTCTYACPRRGKCCECVDYHRRHGEVPGCFFSATGERSYDRSVENLYRDARRKND